MLIDGTLGDGGHTLLMLKAMPEHGRVLAVEQDQDAINRSKKRLSGFADRFQVVHGNFRDLESLSLGQGVTKVDGVLVDLGVSYLQLSDARKGFMFSASGPLDMRMDKTLPTSAEDVVNEFSESELARVVWMYGEERQSKRIARAIVSQRQKVKIETTEQLATIVRNVVGPKFSVKSLARVFQAIRIYVNNELESLQQFLPQAVNLLKTGGRLAVISYHSLEDRLVKEFIQKEAHPCECPPEFPQCVCGKKARLIKVGKLIRPTAEEIAHNSSARSAKLRVAEKL